MRQIGKIDSMDQAQLFLAYMAGKGTEGELRKTPDGWGVWIYSEDDIEMARREYRDFLADPGHDRYRAVVIPAPVVEDPAPPSAARRFPAAPPAAMPQSARLMTPVTWFLVSASVFVAVLTQLGVKEGPLQYLFCTFDGLSRGELWRVVTPTFIHFGFFHILFNMMWLLQLGALIEVLKGRWFLLLLFLAIAIVSNLAQMLIHGPMFGGMSGVVYGLFGYVWMKMKYAPEPGLEIDSINVILMLVWLAMGVLGLAGPVANWAHGIGLLIGVLVGVGPVVYRRVRRGMQ